MNFKLFAAKHRLGLLSTGLLPQIGVEAILVGFDSPTLGLLAGSEGDDDVEIKKVFYKTMRELKVVLLDDADAAMYVSADIARSILSGTVDPIDGARVIWWKIYNQHSTLEQLRVFAGLVSESEDDSINLDDYRRQIVEQCSFIAASWPE